MKPKITFLECLKISLGMGALTGGLMLLSVLLSLLTHPHTTNFGEGLSISCQWGLLWAAFVFVTLTPVWLICKIVARFKSRDPLPILI